MVARRRISHRRFATAAAGLAAAAATLLGAAAARADSPAQVTSGPTIAGTAQQGSTLIAAATWSGDPAPTVAWAWLRCPDATAACTEIPAATADTYVPTADDVGALLRARVTVTNPSGSDDKVSAPTDVVLAAPPPPAPPPPAPPPPASTPTPAPIAAPALMPATTTTVTAPRPLRMLRPFPIIRIKGELTARGARITLVTVRAPRGSLIRVRCRGASCPRSKLARTAAVVRLRTFERDLLAGTRLELTVTRPGAIGKWTVIVIRRGTVPQRRDGCLMPTTMRHVRCPLR